MKWFTRKPKPLPIPSFRLPDNPIRYEKPSEIEVVEVIDPSESLIAKFSDLIKRKLKEP